MQHVVIHTGDKVITFYAGDPVDLKTVKKNQSIRMLERKDLEDQFYKVKNGKWDYLVNEFETAEEALTEGAVDGGVDASVLFTAIVDDLAAGNDMSWIPDGIKYYNAEDAEFYVFPGMDEYREELRMEKIMNGEIEDEYEADYPDGYPEDYPEHKRYRFPQSMGGYHENFNIRDEFRRAFGIKKKITKKQ